MSDLNINWTEKVLEMDAKIKEEMKMENKSKIDNILVTIQTNSAEPLAPAIIKSENDIFLEIYVIGGLSATNQLTPTAVLKKNIQSIGIIGGVDIDEEAELSLGSMNPNDIEDNPKGLYF